MISRVRMGSGGIFNVSPDGEQFCTRVDLGDFPRPIDLDRRMSGVGRNSVVSRRRCSGRFARGGKILLARDIASQDHTSQFSLIPRNGGPNRLSGGSKESPGFSVVSRGAKVRYLYGIGGNKIRIMETIQQARAW